MFSKNFDDIIVVYGEYQPIYGIMEAELGVELHTEIPEKVWDVSRETLLCLDDMVMSLTDFHSDMYIKSRHSRVTPMILSQLVFNSKQLKNILVNCTMIFFMSSKSMLQSFTYFARQSGETKFLVDAYKKLADEPYQYLLILRDSRVPDLLRIRTNIFPDDTSEPPTIFVPAI